MRDPARHVEPTPEDRFQAWLAEEVEERPRDLPILRERWAMRALAVAGWAALIAIAAGIGRWCGAW